ncbi:MAG: UDP-N-acetylmuramate--L-alanine ligase [Actinobacteria bacterium]|nr:UDP-N-acetylmuramate--L-alanine ligase [Actinomycetota bacterium]
MPAAIESDPVPSLAQRRSIHILGVGGPGMSAIASALVGMGHAVSGSDIVESAVLERLRSEGVVVYIGHSPDNIGVDVEALAVSTAIPEDNPEIIAARARLLPVVRRTALLPAIAAERRTIAVTGTHGKTTTSSMLALILLGAGLDPSFLIGGELSQLGTNAKWSDGEWFVLEADESDGSGFSIDHEAVIVTNIEADHLEFHGSFENLYRAFERFIASTSGPVVLCADDPNTAEIARGMDAITYGLSNEASVRIVGLEGSRSGVDFTIVVGGDELGHVHVPVPGTHNALNACAAIALALQLGVSFDHCVAALATFGGIGRRFEPKGEANGVVFVDDYAHLPTEIKAAISAHRYSRTQTLWQDYADAFVDADLLVLTDVYAAGEAPRTGVTGQLIVDAVVAAHPEQVVMYVAERKSLAKVLAAELRTGDLCLTLGAGDITTLADEILLLLEQGSAL